MIRQKKAKCPHCQTLHAYSEVRFGFVNDTGYWKVSCANCGKEFGLHVANPVESSMTPNYLVKERLEGEPEAGLLFSHDIIEYNINLNKTSHEFDYGAATLYRCEKNGDNLELLAKTGLERAFEDIKSQYSSVVNYCLSSRTNDYEFFIAQINIACNCGSTHKATYYADFLTSGSVPQNPSEFLLADIDGVVLPLELTGVFTKTEIMAFLEKLIIRWNLKATSIVIASPFVGHQYLSKQDKLDIWNWLLSSLDYRKAIFITRTNTLNSYKKLLSDQDGLNYEILEEYDLENRLVSANTKKNDFHAKFFVGLGTDSAEILSGSANLVQGPSMENCSFQTSTREIFEKRYWSPLKINVELHKGRTKHWLECSFNDNGWSTIPKSGTEI